MKLSDDGKKQDAILDRAEKCTVLVCSCDSYEDAWRPFFQLFKKFWPDCPYRVLLNTETKGFSLPGLEINSLSLYPPSERVPYGRRMIDHLNNIATPYTIVILDDFFLRAPVDQKEIDRVVSWMDGDARIAYFSFEPLEDKYNVPSARFPGYYLKPVVAAWKYSMQVAIWRTDYLRRAWKAHESPWDWEVNGTYRSFTDRFLYYCIGTESINPFNYGVHKGGIQQGKWVLDDVEPLFSDNGITVDYSIRGIKAASRIERLDVFSEKNPLVLKLKYINSISLKHYLLIKIWSVYVGIAKKLGRPYQKTYIDYLRNKLSGKNRMKE